MVIESGLGNGVEGVRSRRSDWRVMPLDQGRRGVEAFQRVTLRVKRDFVSGFRNVT